MIEIVDKRVNFLKHTLLMLLVMLTLGATAQSDNFIATANRSEVPLNGTVQITYTISNANAKAFTPPNFTPFESLGQSTSTSMNYINGKMSQTKSYIFTLRPTQEGDFTIPPAGAIIDGKNAKTNPIEIKVTAATAQNNNPQQGNNSGNKDIEGQIKDNLFVRVFPSKTSVYEGEQVTLSYKILTRLEQLQDFSIMKSPSYDGFLSHEIELSADQKAKKQEQFNGLPHYSILFKQDGIFPTKAGSYSLDPMETEFIVAVPRRTNSWFQQYEQYKVDIKSNPLNIKVKPLPTAGKPANFTGAVGKFSFSVDYDKTETKVDDPITLKIKVSGTGNIKLLDVPDFELPQSFEVYDPKIAESITKKSYTIGGSKTYEYLIIPRGGGEFQFPDIEFSYFDLETEKYVTNSYPGPLVKVEGEAIESGGFTNTNISKEEIELLSSDIKFIKTDVKLKASSSQKNLISKPIFHVLTWFPLLFALFLPVINNRRKKLNSDEVLVKSKKAHKEAAKRMAKAKKLLSSGEDKTFYNEIVKSIWGYLADKFNIESADLSKKKAIDILTENQISDYLIKDTASLIDNCEMAIYAPSAVGESKGIMLSKAEELIENLEKEIKSK
ncbi:MAG: BatD family protein [Chitinophagales bacterium]